MMKFRGRVRKFGKNHLIHGNSVNNTKAMKTKIFERHSDASFDPPLGQGVGRKHLGWARVKYVIAN